MKKLKNYYFDKFIYNKFNHLLIVLFLSFIINPIFQIAQITFPIMSLIILLTVVLTLRAVIDKEAYFYIYSFIALLTFVLQLLLNYKIMESDALFIVTVIIFIGLFLSIIILLIKKIIKTERVDADTVKGGICVYILIGLLWSLFYNLIYFFDKSAFLYNGADKIDFHYFSFTVLTTLGFGDITPVNKLAMNLCSMEAILGQMFIAIFIAGLIGVHLSHSRDEKKV